MILDIEKLETEAMARTYDPTKPDELTNIKAEEIVVNNRTLFLDISKLLNVGPLTIYNKFRQSFKYLKMVDCNWFCHYLSLVDSKFNILIPKQYNISYGFSQDNNAEEGQFKVVTDNENIIKYNKISEDIFVKQMDELSKSVRCLERFVADNHYFYEFENEHIYCYYQNYCWVISGYNRNNVQEYYDMYLILMSISQGNISNNKLKCLYLIGKNAINYLYKGIDLKKQFSNIANYGLSDDMVTFAMSNGRYLLVIDEAYQKYHRKIKYAIDDAKKFNIYSGQNWSFKGCFKSSFLGNYKHGFILNFPEITDSTELSEIEKRDLLENIIKQKQIELYEHKDYLKNKLLILLINYLKNYLTLEVWSKLNFIDYLCIEKIKFENKTDKMIYIYFKNVLNNGDDELIKSLIDIDYLCSNIIAKDIIMSPEFMAFSCQILNVNKIFILFENNEFIEWK